MLFCQYYSGCWYFCEESSKTLTQVVAKPDNVATELENPQWYKSLLQGLEGEECFLSMNCKITEILYSIEK